MTKPTRVSSAHMISLNIKWNHFVTNDDKLQCAQTDDIEIILVKNRLRWLGHVTRMPDQRPVKNLLYCELSEGTRKVGRPFLRFKDTMKDILKRGGVRETWRDIVTHRVEWRRLVTMNVQRSIRIGRRTMKRNDRNSIINRIYEGYLHCS